MKKYYKDIQSYLEIGCGTGFVFKAVVNEFNPEKSCGTDLFDEGLVYAEQRNPQCNFFRLDVEKENYNEKYDIVGAFDVLEHIKQDEIALTNIHKIVDRGFIITVPQHKSLWSKTDVSAYHCRRYERDEMIQKLEKAGFKVIYCNSFV